jgi:hypothetical protein
LEIVRTRTLLLLGVIAAFGCDDDDTTAPTTTTTSASSSSAGGAGGAQGGAGPQGGGGSGGDAGQGGGTITPMPCNGQTCDLTFRGSGFGAFDGKTVHFGLVVQGQMGLDYESSVVIAGGSFSTMNAGVLDKGTSYFLNYYVDVNDNQACEQNPTDLVARLPLGPIQEHLDVEVTAETNPSNLGCAGFP